jgi:hypothetical protein
MIRPPELHDVFDSILSFDQFGTVAFVKSPIRDACDQRLPPTLPILAPTLRTVIERVEVSLALSMHYTLSRRVTRFRCSTRFTFRRCFPKVNDVFRRLEPRRVESFHRAHF